MHALTTNRLTCSLPDIAADILSRIRRRSPRVHCMTNLVAQNFTANVLLAVGAVPSMTVAPDEIAEFAAHSDALLVNLGTFDRARREAAEIAIEAVTDERRPWVLDPVFVDRSRPRSDFARTLMARTPRTVRLNAAEFAAIAGTDPAEETLKRYALDQLSVIALTGATDTVTDGARLVRIENGDPLMRRVTAMGCAGTALVAACLAVEADSWLAASAGLLIFAIAGECAATRARGPGSMPVEILDGLASLERQTLLDRAKVR